MEQVSVVAAFAAGVLSFISPCVLPLVPGYLAFVSGSTVADLRRTISSASGQAAPPRRHVVLASLCFTGGFSIVFIALGATATTLGQAVLTHRLVLGKVAGVVLILFGLHLMGAVRLGWLNVSKGAHPIHRPPGLAGAWLVGASFAFGWTPCIGPILAGILAVAAAQDSVTHGVQLLTWYSAGLALPFITTSLAAGWFFALFARIHRHFRAVEVASGMFLATVGVLMVTSRFTIFARYLAPYLPTY